MIQSVQENKEWGTCITSFDMKKDATTISQAYPAEVKML
jgi:hypothetical protein